MTETVVPEGQRYRQRILRDFVARSGPRAGARPEPVRHIELRIEGAAVRLPAPEQVEAGSRGGMTTLLPRSGQARAPVPRGPGSETVQLRCGTRVDGRHGSIAPREWQR